MNIVLLFSKLLVAFLVIVGISSCWESSDAKNKELVHTTTKYSSPIAAQTINDIAVPMGYSRSVEAPNSYGAYSRALALSPDSLVYLYDGSLKRNQSAQFAVLTVDIGRHDLQQCADAVMRLRAEYLYAQKRYDDIGFTFTSGDPAPYRKWIRGERVSIVKNRAIWKKTVTPDSSYASFRLYLDLIFRYCGTASLEKELQPIVSPQSIAIGDVVIHGGFPGHAVVVVDKAIRKTDGAVVVLFAQSYMPAQSIHILRNPKSTTVSPWYTVPTNGGVLHTPEWEFDWSELRRFVR